MSGLFFHLTPFAPDQSGVVSALFEMGGLLVVCDAGGCTGNICGFDEPRWETKKCALFSAGLRDMDAILGRDERLIEKTLAAAQAIQPAFVAIIGTPVPAVIGTDFTGLRRMAEKKLAIPVLTFPTTGTGLYDLGLSQAYTALVTNFTLAPSQDDSQAALSGRLGVLGASPLDCGMTEQALRTALLAEGFKHVILHGFGNGLDDIKAAASVEKNLVLAPAGLAAAQLLEQRYAIPYEIRYPLTEDLSCLLAHIKEELRKPKPQILIVHQHVLALTLAENIRAHLPQASVHCATFFDRIPQNEALHLTDEEDFLACVKNGAFDCIIADQTLRPILPKSLSENLLWFDLPHFALSGREPKSVLNDG